MGDTYDRARTALTGKHAANQIMNAKNQRKPKASRFAVRADLLYAPGTLRLPSLNVRQIM